MKHLEIFGDSILKGVVYTERNGEDGKAVSDAVGKYSLFAGPMEELFLASGIESHRTCVMGSTIRRGLRSMQKRLGEHREACPAGGAVLIEFGGNDCDHDWDAISADPEAVHNPHTDPETFASLYTEAVRYVRSLGLFPIAVNLIPMEKERYLHRITLGRSYENVLHWLGSSQTLLDWQERYNAMVESLAARLRCPLIDLRTPFRARPDCDSLLGPDGIHPNEAGHRVIAELLCQKVSALL